jgi:cholesterol transport system auxiliary component
MAMTRILQIAASAMLSLLIVGCALPRPESATLYDLGPLRTDASAVTLPALPPIAIADIATTGWLDQTRMMFRLNYENDRNPRPYAHSRWTMPPAQLISQRLKWRISQAGGTALSAADGALDVPVLRIEVDDFSQQFDAPGQSIGQVALRASVFRGRTLLGQKTIVKQTPAPTADAEGGTRALAAACDVVIVDLMQWLASLPLKR